MPCVVVSKFGSCFVPVEANVASEQNASSESRTDQHNFLVIDPGIQHVHSRQVKAKRLELKRHKVP